MIVYTTVLATAWLQLLSQCQTAAFRLQQKVCRSDSPWFSHGSSLHDPHWMAQIQAMKLHQHLMHLKNNLA